MRLLVAVSNEPLAHAIRGALLAGRHEVSLASTGSIALAAVAKESFDAVILDEVDEEMTDFEEDGLSIQDIDEVEEIKEEA